MYTVWKMKSIRAVRVQTRLGCCGAPKGGRNNIQDVQFSRMLAKNKLTHILTDKTSTDFTRLDALLEKIPTMPDPTKGYTAVLKSCTEHGSLQYAKRIHAHVLRWKANTDILITNLVINTYCRCGSMELARDVFNTTPNRNSYSWSTIISGYVHNGMHSHALDLFHKMNVEPNKFAFAAALSACSHLSDLLQGKKVHQMILSSKMEVDTLIGNALITMYAKCGDMQPAREVFDGMPEKKLVTWNVMISGCVQNRQPEEAIRLYRGLGVKPNGFIFASVLTACSMSGNLELGEEVHRRSLGSNLLENDTTLQRALVSMYVKCGKPEEAKKISDCMSNPAWGEQCNI